MKIFAHGLSNHLQSIASFWSTARKNTATNILRQSKKDLGNCMKEIRDFWLIFAEPTIFMEILSNAISPISPRVLRRT